jgi:uncharacterized protein (DUF427 family)
LERTERHVVVVFNGVVIADTRNALRVLETSHPPVYYLPLSDLQTGHIRDAPGTSYCEWKGRASYVSVRVDDRVAEGVGWYYPDPVPAFAALRDHVAFYAGPMDRVTVDGEVVRPQPGGFYGGWVTSDIVGPFKGEPGTEFW